MLLVSGSVVTHLDCAVLGQTADKSVQSPVLELPLWTLWSCPGYYWIWVIATLGSSVHVVRVLQAGIRCFYTSLKSIKNSQVSTKSRTSSREMGKKKEMFLSANIS